MTATDRRWSDADREPIVAVIKSLPPPPTLGQIGGLGPSAEQLADRLLDALTAAGWRREADVRAEGYDAAVAELRAVHERTGSPAAHWAAEYLAAPTIARAHRTAPPTDRTEETA